MNVKVKYNSNMPDDESYFGGSVADGSVVVHEVPSRNSANPTKT